MRNQSAIAACALALATIIPAAASAKLMPDVVATSSRFSGSCSVWTGAPALAVTLSMVEAGGGPRLYTVTLLKRLTGNSFDAEVAKLTKQYGKEQVGQFLKTFDFVVTILANRDGEEDHAAEQAQSRSQRRARYSPRALWSAGQPAKDSMSKSCWIARSHTLSTFK